MRERLRIFLYLTLFWLFFMICGRIVFLLYNFDYAATLTAGEIALTLLHGLRMDASISGYFIAASGLLLVISSVHNKTWVAWALSGLTVVLMILCVVLVCVDVELYRHWGFRMNTTPLMYLGSEAMGSIQLWVYIKVITAMVVMVSVFLYLFRSFIHPRILYLEDAKQKGKTALTMLALTILMFLPIRGSFTVAPMNTGFVYFHNTKAFANHTAVNVVWNFLYSLRKTSTTEYPSNFFPKDKTDAIFKELYFSTGSTEGVLNTADPNVILIILESFTADVIEPLGGLKGITPNLNQLCQEGILFNNFYSSGDRTDKGLISILSGYPAQPQTSIIKFPAKTERLPQLNRDMKRLGYKTSFIYGGDIDFANFRSYLNTSGFDNLTMLDDFDDDLYTSKWGVHDHFMFAKAQQELDTTTEKFFKVILTLSSHEPFDVPMKPIIEGKDEESLFINSCHYTDKSLGDFIRYCKTKSWWTNTLVVITADHGHRHPGNKELNQKERFRIPLLLTGGAVSRDSVVSVIGSQTDIVNTLLGQLDKPSDKYIFSKDLLNPSSKSFAAYFYNDGYGFITPDSYLIYDNAGKKFLKEETTTHNVHDWSKAFQQKLFTNYNNLDK